MMKKLVATIISICIAAASISQDKEMLVDTNKLWSNLFDTHTGGPPPYYMLTSFVKFSGDTVINSINYKKVLVSQDSLQNNYFINGYICEDSTHKVYYRSKQDTTNYLLYDFNVKVGDTVNLEWWIQMQLVVGIVDSVFVYDKYLKRIILSPNGGNTGEEWIEGIGSLCGVLNSGGYFISGTKHELLCYFEHDTLKYSNPAYPYCYYNTVGLDDQDQHGTEVSLFPNPVTSNSTLLIENMNGKDFNLNIFNLMGKKIKSLNISDNRVLIHKDDFVPGIYFYRIICSPSEVFTGKFIVE